MNVEMKPSVTTPPVKTVAINNSSEKSTTGGIGESTIKPTPSDKVALTFDTTTAPTTSKFGGGETTKTAETQAPFKVAEGYKELTVEDYQSAIRVIFEITGGKLDPNQTVYKVTAEQVAAAFKAGDTALHTYGISEADAANFNSLKALWGYQDLKHEYSYFNGLANLVNEDLEDTALKLSGGISGQANLRQNRTLLSDKDLWKAAETGYDGGTIKYRNPPIKP